MRANKLFAPLLIFMTVLLSAVIPGTHPARAAAQPQSEPIDIDIPILSYHKVDLTAKSKWHVSLEQFRRQLDLLQAYGYTTVSFKDFLDYREGKAVPPPRPVILTFDDCSADLYTYAVPELKARNMTATFFIISNYVGLKAELVRASGEKAEELVINYMSWAQLNELAASGFEMGSHTLNHRVLTEMGETLKMQQIVNSRRMIQAAMPGVPVDVFAYPFGIGADDENVQKYVQANYRAAVAFYRSEEIANPARSDIWALPRHEMENLLSFDLDPNNPAMSILRIFDLDFPLPNISLKKVEFFDAWGSRRMRFYPGEDVYIRMSASNWGQAANVVGTLLLRSGETLIYDSHTRIPSADRRLKPMRRGDNKINFTMTVPESQVDQPLEAALYAYDKSYMVNYYRSEYIPAFTILKSPISVKASAQDISLKPGEEQEITFSVANSGLPAGQMILTVSLSPGLEVTAANPQDNWRSYPAGSQIQIRGCNAPCQASSYVMYEATESAFLAGEQTYRLTIRAAQGAALNQWVKYRIAMQVPDQATPYPYLYAPMGGRSDEQAYFAYQIRVWVSE